MGLRSYLSSRASAAGNWSGTSKGDNSQATSNPIKVLHIINDLSVGGAEITLYKLLSEMDEARFSFAVVSLKNRGKLRERIEALGIPVYTAAMSHAVPTPSSIWRLIRLVRRLKPDVIQGWMSHGNLMSQLTAAFAPRRVAVLWNIRQSLYSLDYEKRITAVAIKLGARISSKPTGIVYNSRIGAAQHAAIGYSLEKALVIHNGFDTELFTPSGVARHSVRSELGVAQNTVLIGLMGRYHGLKDHPNFLRAAALLREKNSDVQFVLAGREINWDNQLLRELIQELGLVERVHLLGERQDMPRITAALDVAVSASFGEGFPNVIGEAMACGVPCVVTDVSDLPWIVGGTGRVVPPRDAAAMAQALVEMIELGVDGREELGAAARARIMEHFCLDSVVTQYEALYENAATRKGIGRFIKDVRYHRSLEQVSSDTHRQDVITGAANVRRSRSSRPKW